MLGFLKYPSDHLNLCPTYAIFLRKKSSGQYSVSHFLIGPSGIIGFHVIFFQTSWRRHFHSYAKLTVCKTLRMSDRHHIGNFHYFHTIPISFGRVHFMSEDDCFYTCNISAPKFNYALQKPKKSRRVCGAYGSSFVQSF